MNEPWTKLPRRLADLAETIGLDRYGALCWLMSHASYAPTDLPGWGTLRRGQIVTSTRRLAEAWGVGHHAARNILADLAEAGLCEVSESRHGADGGTLITVHRGTMSGTLAGTLSGTSKNNPQRTQGTEDMATHTAPSGHNVGHINGHIGGHIPTPRTRARHCSFQENIYRNNQREEDNFSKQNQAITAPTRYRTDPSLWEALDRLRANPPAQPQRQPAVSASEAARMLGGDL